MADQTNQPVVPQSVLDAMQPPVKPPVTGNSRIIAESQKKEVK